MITRLLLNRKRDRQWLVTAQAVYGWLSLYVVLDGVKVLFHQIQSIPQKGDFVMIYIIKTLGKIAMPVVSFVYNNSL